MSLRENAPLEGYHWPGDQVDTVSFGVPNKFSGTVDARVGELTLRLVQRELHTMTKKPILDQLETIVRVAYVIGRAGLRGGAA